MNKFLSIIFLVLSILPFTIAIFMAKEVIKHGGFGGGDGNVGLIETVFGLPAIIFTIIFLYLAYHFFSK